MAAGKHYINTANLPCIPSYFTIYHDDAGTSLGLTPNTTRVRSFQMPIMKDGSGHFVDTPLDPASIDGLSSYVT